MSRFFGSLVDPFQSYSDTVPPASAWHFIARQLAPFRRVIAASLMLTVIGAAIEIWLIGFAGRLVDTLAATTPAELWSRHGGELAFAALIVLVARPLGGYLHESLDDIAFRPSAETLVRTLEAEVAFLGQVFGFETPGIPALDLD